MKMITGLEYDFKHSIRMHHSFILKTNIYNKKDTWTLAWCMKSTVTYVSVYIYWLYIVRTKACEQTKMPSLIEAKEYARGFNHSNDPTCPNLSIRYMQFKSPMWCLDSCQRHIQNPHNQTFLCQMRSNKCDWFGDIWFNSWRVLEMLIKWKL